MQFFYIHLCKVSFFFQAEDGIRYTSVTGVQTCALPIWPCTSRRIAAATAASETAARSHRTAAQIGRASCRERVEASVGEAASKKKIRKSRRTLRPLKILETWP